MDWNNLRYLVEFKRTGTLLAVAKRLEVDATTVSRRIRSLEASFGLDVLERGPDGNLVLTEAGVRAAAQAEQIDQLVADLQGDLVDAKHRVTGVVHLSAVPMLVKRILIPQIAIFSAKYPELTLHLNADNRNFCLTNRETDVALRLGRPTEGGHSLKAYRVGLMTHAVFVPEGLSGDAVARLSWLGYQHEMQYLPQARWMEDNVAGLGGEFASTRFYDADTAIEAVAAGLGKTVLPCLVGQKDTRLQQASEPLPDLFREAWLIHRAEDAKLARVQVVCQCLADLFRGNQCDAAKPI
ncbi:LysR family transcriptional regulator [Labrenzia sp. CE80]|uniref:LysR family transcriptional regulator n=1 Tax=Labrenzia sp. CE80 TaxID=1788986 RepID=UPI00129AEABF|nr:LysR family transcriptional regulator [Labrenzia sp. CE80]